MGLYAISPSGNYRLHVRPSVEEIRDGQGKLVRAGVPALAAQFQQGGGIPDYVREVALAQLSFRGLAENEDPFMRMGWFDLDLAASENKWSDEQKAAVEEKLRAKNGSTDVLIVEPPTPAVPYPKYDQHRKVQGRRTIEHVISDIRATFEAAGFDVDAAVAYESATLNDPQVLDALAALRVEEVPDEEPVIVA